MLCTICERGCWIREGGTGACGMYKNQRGEISEIFPDRFLVTCPISVETMPMLHYHPAGKFLQISTIGCNFDCPACISTILVKETGCFSQSLRNMTPEEVVTLQINSAGYGSRRRKHLPELRLPDHDHR